MSATNDTPIKRFTAFWVVLGAFLLFGIIALILAPLTKTSEVTAADEAGAKRRLAVRELVDAEQVKNLSRVENGDKLQVAPAEVFSLVGAKLASIKPTAMKNEMFRDPSTIQAEEPAQDEATEEVTTKESTPEPIGILSDGTKVVPAPDAQPGKPSAATEEDSAQQAGATSETKSAESAADPKSKPAEPAKAPAPAAKQSPALTPQAPRPESTSESAEPSAN